MTTSIDDITRELAARADGGPLAPADYEGTIVEFYRYVASRLCPGPG